MASLGGGHQKKVDAKISPPPHCDEKRDILTTTPIACIAFQLHFDSKRSSISKLHLSSRWVFSQSAPRPKPGGTCGVYCPTQSPSRDLELTLPSGTSTRSRPTSPLPVTWSCSSRPRLLRTCPASADITAPSVRDGSSLSMASRCTPRASLTREGKHIHCS